MCLLCLQAQDDIANVSTSVPTLKVFYYAGTAAKLGTDEFSRYAGSKDSQFMTIVQGKALAMMAIDLITSEERMRDVFEQHQEELQKFYGPIDGIPIAVQSSTDMHAQKEDAEAKPAEAADTDATGEDVEGKNVAAEDDKTEEVKETSSQHSGVADTPKQGLETEGGVAEHETSLFQSDNQE